jgi:hypothetical protein
VVRILGAQGILPRAAQFGEGAGGSPDQQSGACRLQTRFSICSGFILAGLALLLIYRGVAMTRGVACGLIVVGLVGFAIEGLSKVKNQRYLDTIRVQAADQTRAMIN